MTATISKQATSIAAQQAEAQRATETGAAAATAAKPMISADFNMFLQLLTSQLQHQNPLSPMDTTQFTSQLVQFAQTEQAIQQNSTLKSILTKLGAQEMAQASSYIGRDARFDTPVAGLNADRPASWAYQYSQVPSSLTAEIRDSKGSLVKTMTLRPALKGRVEWDGTLSGGAVAPAGTYTLSLSAKDIDGATVNGAVTAAGRITSAMMLDGRAIVTVNGANYPLDALLAIDGSTDAKTN